MKYLLAFLMLFPLLVSAQEADQARKQAELRALGWQMGPTEGKIGDQANIKVPNEYVFLGSQDTRRFLELSGNPPPSQPHYLIAPKSLKWFAVFSFEATGYVKDDEKINPDELLKQLKESDGPSNEERKRLGMMAIYTDGWQVPPHYDDATKRLEWGTRLRAANGQFVVNYTSRLLGKSGVMSAVLVSDPATLTADTRDFKQTLQDFSYVSGQRYSEWKPGDKVAEYGLAALVLGGAAAVATKKGLWGAIAGFFAAFWKLIVAGVIGALAWMRSLFKRKDS